MARKNRQIYCLGVLCQQTSCSTLLYPHKMGNSLFYLFSICATFHLCLGQVPLIIDTDASFDVDDVIAICMAHALADRGETEILAIVHDAGIPEGIGAVSVLNHYYGRDQIVLGAYKGDFGKDFNGNWVREIGRAHV